MKQWALVLCLTIALASCSASQPALPPPDTLEPTPTQWRPPAPTRPRATFTPTTMIAVTQASIPTRLPAAAATKVTTWSSVSPDGKWVARGMMEGPFVAGDEEKYRYHLQVINAGKSITWTVVDETSRYGLGYITPRPLHWSKDGRYLYFTNEPVPDGCARFVNGSDLQRVDLDTGRVQEMMPPRGAVWLSLSPDEIQLACIYWNGEAEELVLRELATGVERRTTLAAPANSQAGAIVWSPDGKALALTVIAYPCNPENWVHSIVQVDQATLSQKMLLVEYKQLFVTAAWPQEGQLVLGDKDGNLWWLNVTTGQITLAEEKKSLTP